MTNQYYEFHVLKDLRQKRYDRIKNYIQANGSFNGYWTDKINQKLGQLNKSVLSYPEKQGLMTKLKNQLGHSPSYLNFINAKKHQIKDTKAAYMNLYNGGKDLDLEKYQFNQDTQHLSTIITGSLNEKMSDEIAFANYAVFRDSKSEINPIDFLNVFYPNHILKKSNHFAEFFLDQLAVELLNTSFNKKQFQTLLDFIDTEKEKINLGFKNMSMDYCVLGKNNYMRSTRFNGFDANIHDARVPYFVYALFIGSEKQYSYLKSEYPKWVQEAVSYLKKENNRSILLGCMKFDRLKTFCSEFKIPLHDLKDKNGLGYIEKYYDGNYGSIAYGAIKNLVNYFKNDLDFLALKVPKIIEAKVDNMYYKHDKKALMEKQISVFEKVVVEHGLKSGKIKRVKRNTGIKVL